MKGKNNIKNLGKLVAGFGAILIGFYLIQDYIVPFSKVFLGITLIFFGAGYLFTTSFKKEIIKYRIR